MDIKSILSVPVFTIGEMQTSLGTLISAAIVVFATLLIARLARRSVQRMLTRFSEKEPETVRFSAIVVQVIIWVVGFEIALHLLGIHLTSLFAASGFLALGAGFAVKNIVENFLSGGILRLEKTIRPGDLVVVNDVWMYIHNIGLRVTTALSYNGEQILIPNSLIAQAKVVNLTRNNRLYRLHTQAGVSYNSDLDRVRNTLEQTMDKLEWRSRAKDPILYLDEFGNSSINYSVNVWIDDANDSRGRKSDLNEAVWWALKENGITIAYPQLDMHLDNDVTDALVAQKPL